MADIVLIEPMRPEHIDELMPYEKAMFGTEAWTASGYRSELADRRNRHYIVAVDENGALLGWAGVLVVAGAAEILTVGVIPTARRQGIGQRLVDELLTVAEGRAAHEVFLEVRVDNVAAQKLYETKGFQQISVRRGYYEHGRVDAVVMRREL